MNQSNVGGSQRDGVHLIGLLVETCSVQALGTLAVLIIPALAPIVARVVNVPTSYVGYQVAIIYLAAMAASLCAGTFVGIFGPCRTGQIAMLVSAVGCMLVSVPHAGIVILGSITIGCGYGLINPAASDMLIRHGPANRRNLVFSIKQTGVPLGGMIAGMIGPSAAIAFGWQAVLWSVAACSVAAAAASQPARAVLDRHRGGTPARAALPFAALASVMTTPALRWLALSSLCFSGLQLCVVAFLVALLVEDMHYDIVTAGVILGLVQIAGALGRVLWGFVADLVRDGLGVLLGLGLVMATGAAVVAFGGAGLPAWITIGVFLVLGLTAVGWNGIFMSEVARLSPAQSVGATTGATLFFTFTGILVGPTLFSSAHTIIGSYAGSYMLLVGMALLSVGMLGLVWRR
jgi:MFS family permease